MSFQPLVPIPGYAGWRFLERTLASQQEAFSASPVVARQSEHFAEKIGEVASVDDLMSDYQLLRVSLTAFGLEDDIGNRAFIRKVLEEGTIASDAFANRLSDKRYLAMAQAFGFGPGEAVRTGQPGFADEILAAYETRSFEIGVGEQNAGFRLAMTAERELEALASRGLSDDGKWYSAMGSEPLRRVFETAFGLPSAFSQLDIDVQLRTLRDKADTALGDGEISQFADPERRDSLIKAFLLRSEIASGTASLSGQAIALSILGGPAG